MEKNGEIKRAEKKFGGIVLVGMNKLSLQF